MRTGSRCTCNTADARVYVFRGLGVGSDGALRTESIVSRREQRAVSEVTSHRQFSLSTIAEAYVPETRVYNCGTQNIKERTLIDALESI